MSHTTWSGNRRSSEAIAVLAPLGGAPRPPGRRCPTTAETERYDVLRSGRSLRGSGPSSSSRATPEAECLRCCKQPSQSMRARSRRRRWPRVFSAAVRCRLRCLALWRRCSRPLVLDKRKGVIELGVLLGLAETLRRGSILGHDGRELVTDARCQPSGGQAWRDRQRANAQARPHQICTEIVAFQHHPPRG